MSVAVRLALLCAALLAGCQQGHAVRGGTTSTIEKHPYQVAIDEDGEMKCGGALISEKTVITVLTCFYPFSASAARLRVRVGSQFREEGGEAFGVSSVRPHPSYSEYTGDNDVLLVYLEEEVTLGAEVKPIALGAANELLPAGQKLVLTGFGDLKLNEVVPSDTPRQIQVASLPIQNQDICEEAFYLPKTSNRRCAGGLAAGACGKQDVGTPLVDWLGGLVGLVLEQDWVCTREGVYTAFTYVAHPTLYEWITENVDVEPSITTTTTTTTTTAASPTTPTTTTTASPTSTTTTTTTTASPGVSSSTVAPA